MTLDEFVESVMSGEIKVPMGAKSSGTLIDFVQPLGTNDADAVAAEAINRDIVDYSRISWPELVQQVTAIIAKTK